MVNHFHFQVIPLFLIAKYNNFGMALTSVVIPYHNYAFSTVELLGMW